LQTGETLWVLVQFSPVHGDLRLSGSLWTAAGDLAADFDQTLAGGVTHSIQGFEITPEFPAGEGLLVLQLNGHDVATRRVGFVGTTPAGTATSRATLRMGAAHPE
jgi:hypothetical protein